VTLDYMCPAIVRIIEHLPKIRDSHSRKKEKEIIQKNGKTKHMGIIIFFSPLVRTKN